MLQPVAIPIIPEADKLTDKELAVIIQEDAKALEACNGQLQSIYELVKPY